MKRSLPAWAWLALAALSFAAALASWPGPRTASDLPAQAQRQTPPVDAQAQAVTAGAVTDAESPPATPPATANAPVVLDDGNHASTPLPQAGRQVLRCVENGRTVYRDAGTACAEGGGEAITLFPTRGVEAPR
jgi:guanyl-specific ribonuclease Sa